MINKQHKNKFILVAFLKNEQGATAIEYGLLAAILAVGIIVGSQGIASSITNMWTNVAADVKPN